MSDTNHRRLLDMLAGWQEYVLKCSEADAPANPDPSPEEYMREFDEVFALYQACGAKSCPTDAWVRDFVVDRVLPLIVGVEPSQPSSDTGEGTR